MAQAYWHFAFDQKEYYQLMFGLGMPACETVRGIPEMKTFIDVITSVIRKTIAVSNNPDVDYQLKFHTYWSILHGLVSIHMIGTNQLPDIKSELILQDAIGGFIKALQS